MNSITLNSKIPGFFVIPDDAKPGCSWVYLKAFHTLAAANDAISAKRRAVGRSRALYYWNKGIPEAVRFTAKRTYGLRLVPTAPAESWFLLDLSNGHPEDEAGYFYVFAFRTRDAAVAFKREHVKIPTNTELSAPFKLCQALP
jgi:hypothetical protein